MPKIKGKLILVIVFTIIFGLAIWQGVTLFLLRGEVVISTNKTKYDRESIIVKIENRTNKKICFSSCYPYYLERKNNDWKSYLYDNCSRLDLIGNCVKPEKEKYFQIDDLSYTKEGLHRLAVPVCLGCSLAENFIENKRFYSNEFLIIK